MQGWKEKRGFLHFLKKSAKPHSNGNRGGDPLVFFRSILYIRVFPQHAARYTWVQEPFLYPPFLKNVLTAHTAGGYQSLSRHHNFFIAR